MSYSAPPSYQQAIMMPTIAQPQPQQQSILYSPTSVLSPDSPIRGVINVNDYSRPVMGFYNSLNDDPEFKSKIIKHYYYKLLDKWIPMMMTDIFGYMQIKDNKVVVVQNVSDYKPSTSDDMKVIEKKIDFIEEKIVSKKNMYKYLSDFIKRYHIEWVDIPKYEKYMKKELHHALKKRFKQVIKSKSV